MARLSFLPGIVVAIIVPGLPGVGDSRRRVTGYGFRVSSIQPRRPAVWRDWSRRKRGWRDSIQNPASVAVGSLKSLTAEARNIFS